VTARAKPTGASDAETMVAGAMRTQPSDLSPLQDDPPTRPVGGRRGNGTTLTKACEMCGNSFTPKRSDARTCSTSCRSRARNSLPVRIRAVKDAISALADVAAEQEIDGWTEVWREIAAHLRTEIARVGRGKS
jgi:hypothetical protein